MKLIMRLLVIPLISMSIYSCSHGDKKPQGEKPVQSKNVVEAHAIFKNLTGKEVGHVVIKPYGEDGVSIDGSFYNLKPNSTHGIHVHEVGDCGDQFNRAGGHFNPAALHHGAPHDKTHAGDLGNIKSDKNGKATLSFKTDKLSINGGDKDMMNRSMIIHADKDDLKSQPAGNSGKKMACAIIN